MDEKNKFLDGYVVGLKRAVNLKTGKLTGLKSHDFHILTERIIHVMFHGYMPNSMWQAIAELSYFYKQICAKEISKNMMEKLEKEIPVLLCKLEKIFPPRFFNPMEHLLIHIPLGEYPCVATGTYNNMITYIQNVSYIVIRKYFIIHL
jgi:hypothetical protein